MQGAKSLVDNRTGPSGGGFNRESFRLNDLHIFLRLRVVGEESVGTVFVGEVIDGIADPHRVDVTPIYTGNFDDRRVGEISDPKLGGCAAAIVVPRSPGLGSWPIGDVRTIRRVGTLIGERQRQLCRETAGEGYGVEPLNGGRVGIAWRGKKDAFAIRSPARGNIRARMKSETPRRASHCGQHVHVEGAVIFAGESDPFPVR